MTKRQKEELAKLYMDLGKLTLGSFVLSVFQTNLGLLASIILALCGLTISTILFKMGLKLVGEVK